ncbi:MAG: hypothetical protein L3J45_08890 [Flavobacteriaceae bacterium]|nr:hypothetical protein [Flavobacteriaceae bacterium]
MTSVTLAQSAIDVPKDEAFVIEKNQAVNSLFKQSTKITSKYFKQESNGDNALKSKKWGQAMTIYKELIGREKDNADYHYKYGAALGFNALEGNKFKALFLIGKIKSEFLKAAKLDPNHIDTRWALIETYLRLPYILGGRISRAKYYANQLEEISKIDGFLAKGRIAKYNKSYKIAEVYFNRAVETGGSKNAYYRLAELYDVYLDKPKKALEILNIALNIYPKDLRFHYQYGKIALQNELDQNKGKLYLKYFISHYSSASPIALSNVYKLLML